MFCLPFLMLSPYTCQKTFWHLLRDTIQAEWLARLYTNQIGTLFSFVSQPVIMMNSRNAPLYALFLASHNERAVKIVDDIFKRYEHLRDLGQ